MTLVMLWVLVTPGQGDETCPGLLKESLRLATACCSDRKNDCLQSSKPVILVGPQAKPFKAIEATVNLADKTKYATAVIPNAKVICLIWIPPWMPTCAYSPTL